MHKITSLLSHAVHRRLPPQQRRQQIIAEARKLFAEQGVASVTMRSLGKRCGITQASIYQHFADKDAILFAICDGYFNLMLEEFRKASETTDDPLQKLLAIMDTYIELGLSHPEEYRLTFMTSVSGITDASQTGENRAGAGEKVGSLAFNFLQERIAGLMTAGQLRAGDPAATAEAIWAAGHGLVSLLITHTRYVWSDIQAVKQAHLGLMLQGMLTQEAALALGPAHVQNSASKISR
ncbi:MAG: TetR/AcrR family transcriptional regulator [Alphaproteobacteria bacterium]|nr:TetR/AcrR family transcriptional regulator [Alphaproteobacteria bacterium]